MGELFQVDPEELGELKLSEQTIPLLLSFAEELPGGFFIYRADNSQEIVYANHAALRIFGCETLQEFRELTGGSFRGIVHPDDFDSTQDSIDEQIEDETNDNIDYVKYRILRKDGGVRWVEDYGRYVILPDYGDVYFVFLTDVTEREKIRDENRRRDEVIRGLSVSYGSILYLDLDHRELIPYRLSVDYFQIIDEELKMKQPNAEWNALLYEYAQRYVLPQDQDRFLWEIAEQNIRSRLVEEKSYTVEYRRVSDEGEVLYTQMVIALIEGRGHHMHVVMGFRDVTEQTLRVQKEAGEKFHMEMDLEREKRANEVKSDFLYNISHDIRTPMNAIMVFSDLARHHTDDAKLLGEYLGKVEDSTYQLLDLIDDMLEMGKIDYGRIQLKKVPADLVVELGTTLDLFRAEAETEQIKFLEDIDLPEEEVMLDTHRFRRVMDNLISNAIKFTPEGGTVLISARKEEPEDPHEDACPLYVFSVSDTGIGMSEDFMHRMYEAFESEENSSRAGTIGTGLGLTITKRLLNLMGGTITVQSEPEKGSVFTVELPLEPAGENRSPEEEEESAERELSYENHGVHRILLVEDIEINRELVESVLSETGYLVESVGDGASAVDAVASTPPGYYDLILMDIRLPVMNGYEATKAIRGMDREDVKDLPIIALSANAREEDKASSIESGMNTHIAKPYDIEHLIRTIQEHIAAGRQGEEA